MTDLIFVLITTIGGIMAVLLKKKFQNDLDKIEMMKVKSHHNFTIGVNRLENEKSEVEMTISKLQHNFKFNYNVENQIRCNNCGATKHAYICEYCGT